jgi:hypothetical protein
MSTPAPPPLPSDAAARQQLLTCATTEEYALQAARAATIADSSARASMFLTSVTGTLIALGFIAQATRIGPAFYMIASVLFGCLTLLGFTTFVRVAESGIEDTVCARGMNRLRHLYTDIAPALAPYLIMGTSDDLAGHDRTIVVFWRRAQVLLTTASTVALLTAICGGATVGLVAGATGAALRTTIALGIGVGVIVLAGLVWAELRTWYAEAWRIPVAFPHDRSD